MISNTDALQRIRINSDDRASFFRNGCGFLSVDQRFHVIVDAAFVIFTAVNRKC